jgi:hypothetical protein
MPLWGFLIQASRRPDPIEVSAIRREVHSAHGAANGEVIGWHGHRLTYLEGVLVNELEKGVRFVIERHRPMEEPATAKSHPSRLQILVPAVHKASESTM